MRWVWMLFFSLALAQNATAPISAAQARIKIQNTPDPVVLVQSEPGVWSEVVKARHRFPFPGRYTAVVIPQTLLAQTCLELGFLTHPPFLYVPGPAPAWWPKDAPVAIFVAPASGASAFSVSQGLGGVMLVGGASRFGDGLEVASPAYAAYLVGAMRLEQTLSPQNRRRCG